MKKILMFLASDNFRDTEYLTPRAFFEQNNVNVMTISSQKISRGRFSFIVKNDYLINDEIDPAKFSGIFLVGGGGVLDYLENRVLRKLVWDFSDSGKIIGAICAAPRLLLKWGLLKNKKFTGWNGDGVLEKLGKENFAEYTNLSVQVDKNFVTGDGPNSVEETALEFLKLINGGGK